MGKRTALSPGMAAQVLLRSRRRCCFCFGLNGDANEKKGQIAHLDRDASNNSFENLAFLCFDHHDQYDSRTSQAKGLTIEEARRFRGALDRHVAERMPATDADILASLIFAFDRPAFRTPFQNESSLPRFRVAIQETIDTLSTGRTPSGTQLPSKNQLQDPESRKAIEELISGLVRLRASFDELVRAKEIQRCGCSEPDCPVFMFSDRAVREMDDSRSELLRRANRLSPSAPDGFYQGL